MEFKMKEISIDKIKTHRNIRTEIGELSELMSSIKQHGLLEPIGVWHTGNEFTVIYGHRRLQAVKKLGWKKINALVSTEQLTEKDFLFLNTIENIHRKDISPVELGGICQRLRDIGLSHSEIAARLSIPKAKVKTTLQIYQRIPIRFRSSIGNIKGREDKRGRIPLTIAQILSKGYISRALIGKSLDYAKREGMSVGQARLLSRMLGAGMPFDKAIKRIKTVKRGIVDLFVYKAEMNKLIKQHNVPSTKILKMMLKRTIPYNEKLFVDMD